MSKSILYVLLVLTFISGEIKVYYAYNRLFKRNNRLFTYSFFIFLVITCEVLKTNVLSENSGEVCDLALSNCTWTKFFV